ncbi:MAG: hypothetical protein FWH14_01905 [Oscillospiraceae bacterium]|nr:hypothetical protein [Oscillospiraceae bacterium]
MALPLGELSAATPTERAGRGGNLPPVAIMACRDDRPRSSVVIADCGRVRTPVRTVLLPT